MHAGWAERHQGEDGQLAAGLLLCMNSGIPTTSMTGNDPHTQCAHTVTGCSATGAGTRATPPADQRPQTEGQRRTQLLLLVLCSSSPTAAAGDGWLTHGHAHEILTKLLVN